MPYLTKPDTLFLAELAGRIESTLQAGGGKKTLSAADAERLLSIIRGADTDADTDGRTTKRRIRIRLYATGANEPSADSEPGAPPDRGGTWEVAGLPATALALAQTAMSYHVGALISGLDRPTLMRRINGLRPTLSRRGGDAVWRVPYDVDGSPWMARVDVENL